MRLLFALQTRTAEKLGPRPFTYNIVTSMVHGFSKLARWEYSFVSDKLLGCVFARNDAQRTMQYAPCSCDLFEACKLS